MLKELEIFPIRPEVIFKEGNFPLIDKFANQLKEVVPIRDKVVQNLEEGNVTNLEKMGFPQDIIPVMQLWKQEGPDILGSFAHPEELDLYKFVSLFNLKAFQKRMALSGVDFPKILINYYDTVLIGRSAEKPFKLGSFGSDFNLFGVKEKEVGSSEVSKEKARDLKEKFKDESTKISDALFIQLREDVVYTMREKEAVKGRKKIVLEGIKRGLERRVLNLATTFEKIAPLQRSEITLSQLLMDFQKELGNIIFNSPFSSLALEEQFGYESILFSKNDNFLNLVKESVKILIETRGIILLKSIIAPWEGLAIIVQNGGDRLMLTKDEENNFCFLDKFKEAQRLPDDKVMRFLFQGLPLGKLESLALIAGGFTLHMGSEYGIREKVVKILGASGEAEKYLLGLRIGEDKEQGNEGILFQNLEKNSKNYMPLPLMYVLLGRDGTKKFISQIVGETNKPYELGLADLRCFVAQQLVNEELEKGDSLIDATKNGIYVY